MMSASYVLLTFRIRILETNFLSRLKSNYCYLGNDHQILHEKLDKDDLFMYQIIVYSYIYNSVFAIAYPKLDTEKI